MSHRRFDPEELDQPMPDDQRSIAELERYASTADADAPAGFTDRVMAAIERVPAPRRGIAAWLTGTSRAGGGTGRFLRAGAVAATLILAVAGALFAGQLADILRSVGSNGTPTPSASPAPSVPASTSPTPSASIEVSPSATASGSDDNGGSAGDVPTAVPTLHETPNGTPADTPEESKTPRPSETATASPTATPQQSN